MVALLHFSPVFSNLSLQLKCCGVDNVSDWTSNPGHFNFDLPVNKPEGCCKIGRPDGTNLSEAEIAVEKITGSIPTFLINFLFVIF